MIPFWIVQDDLYEEYKEDFDSVCDFTSITNPDCGLKFDGDNETYVAACLDKNGQIFKREIKLKCGYSVASFDYDLGLAPTCVGASCNLTAIGPEDLKDTRFDELLGNFSFVGCDAVSGATGYSLSPVFYTTIVVAGIVGMIGI
ncbi:expressed unknown protein [Seminavis robusta]|uniref:Uncharacterized protein n=1 Tax=Seminavis robusta TaxID=568900 RepID=A0A9N8H1J3_9STRA|nr:expressed unknown protein [Seminavis robusta]|eukprot:Sro18_g012880.1 n/a (144) ;mRNA; f:87338-87769